MPDFDSRTLQERNSSLLDFIHNLSEEKNLTNSRNTYINKLISIYSDGWRHSYSVITLDFFTNYELNEFDSVLNDLVEKLYDLLSYLIDNQAEFFANLQDEERKYKNTRRNIEKLIDHLNLELIRKRYIEDLYSRVDRQSKIAQKSARELQDFVKEVEHTAQNVVQDSRKDSITILGIFASIVTVFAASIGISSAIFSSMNEISSWILCALTCLVVLFVSNTLFYLFNFLREMADKRRSDNLFLWFFDGCLTGIIIFCLYMHFYYIP